VYLKIVWNLVLNFKFLKLFLNGVCLRLLPFSSCIYLSLIESLSRFLKASSSLGINVFSLFRNNIFEVFITCYFNLNFAHCIRYMNLNLNLARSAFSNH